MPLRSPILLVWALLTAGCAASGHYQIPFMRPPALLVEGVIDPFMEGETVALPEDPEIPYATLRIPSGDEDDERFYTSRRAAAVRLGLARVTLGRSDITWAEARRISILKNATDEYPIQVDGIRDYGVLERTRHPLLEMGAMEQASDNADAAFAAEVNRRLAKTVHKDIFIYVPGYRVNFENPVLVAAELWHFLGYQGVFIPFSWPAHEGRLAYFGDTESAKYGSIFFREFLQYLAEETEAPSIHVLAYSAGTRMVAAALHEIALLDAGMRKEGGHGGFRIGDVILVGSDIDRGIFGTYLLDGMLNVVDHLTLYESPRDKALGIADLVFGNERLGQMMMGDFSEPARRFLLGNPKISIISVSKAYDFDAGNGHSYFRDSPWVSSDVLATLLYDLRPADRGLLRPPNVPVWQFPPDYIERLHAAIIAANPELEAAAREAGMLDGP